MKSNTNKRARKGRARRPRRNRTHKESGNMIVRDSPRFPNDIKQIPIHNRAIRYISNNTVTNFALTPTILLQQVVATTNTSTSTIRVYNSVRLRRISLYFVPSTGDFGSNTNVLNFQWTGTLNSPDNLITDRGTATQPACIKVVPPPNSLSSFWFDANSPNVAQTICTFSCPANTIIDIDFDFTIGNGNTGTVVIIAAATTTGVAILHLSSNVIIPDGGVTTYRT